MENSELDPVAGPLVFQQWQRSGQPRQIESMLLNPVIAGTPDIMATGEHFGNGSVSRKIARTPAEWVTLSL